MTINLSDTEREVWKDLYRLHEKWHGMAGTTDEWMSFAFDLSTIAERYGETKEGRLAQAMSLALYDWFGEEQKRDEEEARRRSVLKQALAQGAEAIPWT